MSEGIVFYDDQNLSSGDMTVIRSGLLDIYNNINGARHKTATLNRVAVGVAAVNKWLGVARVLARAAHSCSFS